MERKQSAKAVKSFESGGERGIRTLDTGFSPYNGLANRRLHPLALLSSITYVLAIVLSCLLYTIGTSRIRGMAGDCWRLLRDFPWFQTFSCARTLQKPNKSSQYPHLHRTQGRGHPTQS